MFNIGSGELALIAVVALLVLGPTRLPQLARGIGKFLREFRRQTDEVRHVVEREFYKMDSDFSMEEPAFKVRPAIDAQATDQPPSDAPLVLPEPEHVASQLTAGMPAEQPAAPGPAPAPAAAGTKTNGAEPSPPEEPQSAHKS